MSYIFWLIAKYIGLILVMLDHLGRDISFNHNHYCLYLGLLIYSDHFVNANHPLNWFVEERCLIAFLIAQTYNFTPGG